MSADEKYIARRLEKVMSNQNQTNVPTVIVIETVHGLRYEIRLNNAA